MPQQKPVVTVIVATFNSEKTLPLVFEGLNKQTYPRQKIEILIVDGGSQDNTLKIARKNKSKIIKNPRTEPVFAKYLGYIKARGKYIIYLDHDEVLENNESIMLKYAIFKKNPLIHAVLGSGYKSPKGYAFINNYINEFGDPFSFFIYRLSKNADFFLSSMKRRYKCVFEDRESVIFDLSNITRLPIIELCAAGSMVDKIFMQKHFPATMKKPELIPHFFYLMQKSFPTIAITKQDALIHYSSDTLAKYLNKLRWRIKNNIYHVKDMGQSGFRGREKYGSMVARYKKFLYLPYVYTLIFCLLDAVKLSITRKDMRYFLHIPLSFFTANQILYHGINKILGSSPRLKSYDESKQIS